MYRVLANVSSDDEGVIMWIMLQSEICLCERYRDMRPRSSETFAFVHMRYCSEIFFALSLRLVHWFIGPSGDGIDDVDHTAGGGICCSFQDLS